MHIEIKDAKDKIDYYVYDDGLPDPNIYSERCVCGSKKATILIGDDTRAKLVCPYCMLPR